MSRILMILAIFFLSVPAFAVHVPDGQYSSQYFTVTHARAPLNSRPMFWVDSNIQTDANSNNVTCDSRIIYLDDIDTAPGGGRIWSTVMTALAAKLQVKVHVVGCRSAVIVSEGIQIIGPQ